MRITILFMCLLCDQAFAQDDFKVIDIGAWGEVEYVVTDPKGRRAGVDPRSEVRYGEINNSYGVYSVDSEDPDIPAPPSVMEFITYSPIAGTYRLTIFGVSPSKYRIAVTMAARPSLSTVLTLEGVVDSLQSVEYSFHYDTTGRNAWFRKIIEPQSLRQDLDNCYKLDLLGGRPLYTDLKHRVKKYEQWMERRGAVKARHELQKLKEKLDQVHKKTKRGTQDKNHFVTDLAYRILQEDIEALLSAKN